MSDLGTIDFDVAMRHEKVIEVTDLLLKEIRNFVKEGPTENELAHIKKRYFFELDSELDDPYRQVVRYAFPHLYSREMSLIFRNLLSVLQTDKVILLPAMLGSENWQILQPIKFAKKEGCHKHSAP